MPDLTNPSYQASDLRLSATAYLPTPHGDFCVQGVLEENGNEHLLVTKGKIENREDVPLRIHSECTTSGALHSLRCDCDQQLVAALEYFEAESAGVLLYLRQEGRGIGLFNKIEAYALQDSGLDTVEANTSLGFATDLRSYEIAFRLIKQLGLKSVRLLTNNPRKITALETYGVVISDRVPLQVASNKFNHTYLQAKKKKMSHLLY